MEFYQRKLDVAFKLTIVADKLWESGTAVPRGNTIEWPTRYYKLFESRQMNLVALKFAGGGHKQGVIKQSLVLLFLQRQSLFME
jgi:hypothetical protein